MYVEGPRKEGGEEGVNEPIALHFIKNGNGSFSVPSENCAYKCWGFFYGLTHVPTIHMGKTKRKNVQF